MRDLHLTGFDQLNNPYFEFALWKLHSNGTYIGDLDLDYCPEEFIDSIIGPQLKSFYFHDICIKNQEEAAIYSNIWDNSNSTFLFYSV